MPDALFGQRVDETVVAGPLEARERRRGQAVRVERIRRDLAGAHDVGDDALAEALVVLADDGCLVHAGMAHEPLLDLERMHVLAARDDHVVDAADEVEVAVGVELPEVAGEVPAVPDLPLVGVGPLPVAGERLVARERAGHLAHLARRDDLGLGDAPSARARRGGCGRSARRARRSPAWRADRRGS